MKRILFFLLTLTAALSALAHDFEVDGIYYTRYSYNTVSVSYKGTSYSAYSNEYSGSVNIPPSVTYSRKTYSVTSIGSSAFWYCSGLTSVTIPNSVTSIGESAFCGCSGLTSVTIGNSVKTIGNYAFYGCSGLKTVNWNAKNCAEFLSYSFAPFYQLAGITTFNFGNEVETIPAHLCDGFSGLTSVTIPNSVTSIGEAAFYGCSGLTSVTIPNSVTSIGYCAFSDCGGLTSIVVESGNTTYDSRNNCNAIIKTSANELISGCKNTVIPNSVTEIGSSAFSGCRGLTSVAIGDSVTSIGDYAFSSCSGLTSATIPNSVTKIGRSAFSGCSGLTSVTNYAETPQYINSDVFNNVNISSCKLYVWHESIYKYKSASVWKNFDIQDMGGVEGVEVDEPQKEIEGYYNLQGVRLNEPVSGQVNIVRYTDGSTKKIIVK